MTKTEELDLEKKHFFNTIVISAMMTSLVLIVIGPVSASHPGQDYEFDYSPSGPYSEWVYALVGGEYGASYYDYGYFDAERYKGSANFMGYLWFWIDVDGSPIEWYTSENYWQDEDEVDATEMSMESLSWFYAPGKPNWYRIAFADIGY